MARFLRGVVLAIFCGGLGWIASRLTVGMLLSRHFNSAYKTEIERLLPWLYLAAGFVLGVAYDPRWFQRRAFRPIGWGAVAGLTVVMLCVRVPVWWYPELDIRTITVFGTTLRIGLQELGLLSAPGALFAGGFLGWYFHRRFVPDRPDAKEGSA